MCLHASLRARPGGAARSRRVRRGARAACRGQRAARGWGGGRGTTSTRTSPTSTWPLSCADEFSVKAAAAAAAAAVDHGSGGRTWGTGEAGQVAWREAGLARDGVPFPAVCSGRAGGADRSARVAAGGAGRGGGRRGAPATRKHPVSTSCSHDTPIPAVAPASSCASWSGCGRCAAWMAALQRSRTSGIIFFQRQNLLFVDKVRMQ